MDGFNFQASDDRAKIAAGLEPDGYENCDDCGGDGRLEPEDIPGCEMIGLPCPKCGGKGYIEP